jgi:acetyl-CoA synthetase
MTAQIAPSSHNPVVRVEQLLDRYCRPGTCVAELLCDQHPADRVAYTVIDRDLNAAPVSYGELRQRSERFAAALAALGVTADDRVATLMSKSIDYVTVLLGIWRLGAVHVPLFTAFAPPAIAIRVLGSATKVIVCDATQRSKLEPGGDIPSDPPWRTVVASTHRETQERGELLLADLLERGGPGVEPAAMGGDAALIHIYTSGTTGMPKGVVVPVKALAAFRTYMEYGLDVRSDDVFWCAADPGWAYGLYYAILGPLTLGVPALLLDAPFSPDLTWSVLEQHRVTNLAAAPTVYRALRASFTGKRPGVALRCASSAGEPLTPEVNEWATVTLGTPVHDHYGQTEAGMLINNHHHPALRRPLKPGCMGRPMTGWSVHVLTTDRDLVAKPGDVGRIAVDMHASPLAWFHGYHGAPEATATEFGGDGRWYYTGDTGSIDDDGEFFFTSRDDDVIIMAGYRIGPFEVESVLATHPAVVECAAIGVPDDIRGEVLEAHVVLAEGYAASDELATELQTLVKQTLAAHAYPRNIVFIEHLPKTPSGKIQRFVLRQQRSEELAGSPMSNEAGP